MVQNVGKVCLVLGCHRNVDGGYVYCHGISNVILDFSSLDNDLMSNVIDFLDQSTEIVNIPVTDYNKVVNVISFLYKNYRCIGDDTLHKVQHFIKMHRSCGLILEIKHMEV